MSRAKPPELPGVAISGAPSGRYITIAISVFLGLWLLAFAASRPFAGGPNGAHLGGDFAIFVSGASVLGAGGNPYDRSVLYRAERRLLQRQELEVPKEESFIRVGNPPLLFWALEPLPGVSFIAAGWAWVLSMYLLLGACAWLSMATLGWRRRALPLALFLAVPQTMFAAYYGNVDALVLLGVVAGFALSRRLPVVAGLVLTLAWLKPQVALPIAALIALFYTTDRARLLAGLTAGSSAGLLASVLLTAPHTVMAWFGALSGYSRELGVQPDIASLGGLYVYCATAPLRLALEASLLASATGLTVWWWRRHGDVTLAGTAWLWMVWFLATPFAHFHDEVVLVLPVLALLGPDARWAGRPMRSGVLLLLLLSILLFPTSRFHTDLQSLALIPAAVIALRIALKERAGNAGDKDAFGGRRMPPERGVAIAT